MVDNWPEGGERMTAKVYLSQARRIDQRVNSKLEQARSLRVLAEKATSTLTNIFEKGARNVSRMEDVIAKMVDLEAEINGDIDALVDLKREIITVINRLENTEYQILLELRYLNFMRWETIAMEMDCSLQHMFKLHAAALREIESSIRVK